MKRTLLMAVASSTGMTLFSYLVSFFLKEKFPEAELFNQLVFYKNKQQKKHHPAGFFIYYAVGTFFTALYYRVWKRTTIQREPFISSVFGFINGLAGIAGRNMVFNLHPGLPEVWRNA